MLEWDLKTAEAHGRFPTVTVGETPFHVSLWQKTFLLAQPYLLLFIFIKPPPGWVSSNFRTQISGLSYCPCIDATARSPYVLKIPFIPHSMCGHSELKCNKSSNKSSKTLLLKARKLKKQRERMLSYPLTVDVAGERQGLRTGRLLLLLERFFLIDKSRTPSDKKKKNHN